MSGWVGGGGETPLIGRDSLPRLVCITLSKLPIQPASLPGLPPSLLAALDGIAIQTDYLFSIGSDFKQGGSEYISPSLLQGLRILSFGQHIFLYSCWSVTNIVTNLTSISLLISLWFNLIIEYFDIETINLLLLLPTSLTRRCNFHLLCVHKSTEWMLINNC